MWAPAPYDVWAHIVSAPFERPLPVGHVQVTLGDIVWLEGVLSRRGPEGLKQALLELVEEQIPVL